MQIQNIGNWGRPLVSAEFSRSSTPQRNAEPSELHRGESVCDKFECKFRARCRTENINCWQYLKWTMTGEYLNPEIPLPFARGRLRTMCVPGPSAAATKALWGERA